MTAKRRIYFRVGMDMPPNATVEDCREFIDDAVGCWAGQCQPDGWDGPGSVGDPMYLFDNRTLKVTRIRK